MHRGAALRPALARPAHAGLRGGASPRGSACAHASAVSSGTAGAAPRRCARSACEAGDEVVTSPFSFVASANVILYEGATPVFADIDPRTLNLDPAAAAAAITGPHARAAAGAHLRLPGRPARRSRRTACRSSRTPARRSAPRHADGTAVGGRGHPAAFGFYANKQLTTGEGGMLTLASAEHKARVDSERNQGRAPDMGWLDHDRLGFNYRHDRHPVRDRARASSSASTGCSPTARAWPRCYREALAGHRGARAAVRGRRRRRARLVRVRRPAPARRRRATT